MSSEDFKDFTIRTVSKKILCYKVIVIAKSPKYDRYQKRLASIIYILLKILLVGVLKTKTFVVKRKKNM